VLGRITIERRFRFILLGFWWRRGIYHPPKISHNRGYDRVNDPVPTGRAANKCNEEKQRVNNYGHLKDNTRFFHEAISDFRVAKNIRK
jgi:hypothetical protein